MWVRVAGVVAEASGAVSMLCERGAACLPSVCESVSVTSQSRGSVVVELGRKASLKATRNLRLSFWGSKNILHTVVKSSLLFFFPSQDWHVQCDTLQGFQEQVHKLWSWHCVWQHGCFCSQSRSANKEIQKYFKLPQPGKLKCSFHKCFSIWLTVCCFCGRLCLCLGKKEKKKKKTQTSNPPSLLWTEMPRRPRLLQKGFGQLCKGLCCSTEASSQD